MKKNNIILSLLLITFVSYGFSTINVNTKTDLNTNLETSIISLSDIYPAVATTQLGNGLQNYSVGIEVHCSYGKNISKVTCNGRSVSYYPDYNQSNTYYFNYNNYAYYFTW